MVQKEVDKVNRVDCANDERERGEFGLFVDWMRECSNKNENVFSDSINVFDFMRVS